MRIKSIFVRLFFVFSLHAVFLTCTRVECDHCSGDVKIVAEVVHITCVLRFTLSGGASEACRR